MPPFNFTFGLDPSWPWSLPGAGPPALAATALALVGLTCWTYLGVRGATFGRLLLVLALRLAALAVALLVVLRPSLAFEELEGLEPSKLIVILDATESMNVKDEFNNESRWESARRVVSAPAVVEALKRLHADEKVQVVFYQAADRVDVLDAKAAPAGKHSHLGAWLQQIWDDHGGGAAFPDKLRGIVLLSDGADNGPPGLAVDKARQWRGVAPVYAFGLGKQEGPADRKDVVVASVQVSPAKVPAKTKMTVRAVVHAPGFAGAAVDVSVWLRDSAGKAAQMLGDTERVQLGKERDNEIVLSRDAPDKADEYKVTVKVSPVPGEADEANNENWTYAEVTKEGVSVLWVDRRRAYEPVFIQRFALGGDRRFRVFSTVPEDRRAAAWDDWYELDRRHYDVIVIGDVSAQRFSGGNPRAIEKVRDLVKEGKTGLVMLGGFDTFAKGEWDKTPLAPLLPVKLDNPNQSEGELQVRPDEAALKLRYPFLRLDADEAKNRELWASEFKPLDGAAHLGAVNPGATVLAYGAGKEPILVAGEPAARVLVFGGDTTWKAWRMTPRAAGAFNGFWKQAILWAARHDLGSGELWARLDARDVPANTAVSPGASRLRFEFGLRGKTGLDVADAQYTFRLVDPGGKSAPLAVLREAQQRGNAPAPTIPGEYQLVISGKGTDPSDGKEVDGARTASFYVRSEPNAEATRTAADPDLLSKLAGVSGGQFHPADERMLLKLLDDLKGQARGQSHVRTTEWPNWKRVPDPEDRRDQLVALWESSALVCFLAFVLLLGAEWGLRRVWGLV